MLHIAVLGRRDPLCTPEDLGEITCIGVPYARGDLVNKVGGFFHVGSDKFFFSRGSDNFDSDVLIPRENQSFSDTSGDESLLFCFGKSQKLIQRFDRSGGLFE